MLIWNGLLHLCIYAYTAMLIAQHIAKHAFYAFVVIRQIKYRWVSEHGSSFSDHTSVEVCPGMSSFSLRSGQYGSGV